MKLSNLVSQSWSNDTKARWHSVELVRNIDDGSMKSLFLFRPTLTLRIACLSLCFLSALVGSAQDMWHPVPTVALGPNDPDLVGAAVDAVATRGKRESRARVVISGQRKWGTADIGIWIDGLNEVIPEKELWPYTGPDPGREALNPHMMEIRLVSPRGKVQFDSRMLMEIGLSFPKGVAAGEEYLFTTNCKTDKRFKAFIDQMNAGFDYGIVTIGRGVFSPPIEVKFGGEGIRGQLMPAMDWAKARADNMAKARANTPTK